MHHKHSQAHNLIHIRVIKCCDVVVHVEAGCDLTPLNNYACCFSNSPSIFLRRPMARAIYERCMLVKRYPLKHTLYLSGMFHNVCCPYKKRYVCLYVTMCMMAFFHDWACWAWVAHLWEKSCKLEMKKFLLYQRKSSNLNRNKKRDFIRIKWSTQPSSLTTTVLIVPWYWW